MNPSCNTTGKGTRLTQSSSEVNIYHETHTHTTYYSLLIPVTVSQSSGTVARPGLKHWKSNAHATTPQSTYTVISC